MPVTYQSPGVYVQEVDRGIKPIQGVGTSLPAFVGITQRAGKKESVAVGETTMSLGEQAYVGKPKLVANWTQYADLFGETIDNAYLPDAVYGYFANGGGSCYVVSLRTTSALAAEGTPARKAGVSIPGSSRSQPASFRVVARNAGAAENDLQVVVALGEDGTFSLQIGDESKSGLVMGSTEANSIAATHFARVEIVDVGTNPPKPGMYILSGGVDAAAPPAPPLLTLADYSGTPSLQTGFCGLEAIDDLRLLVCPDIMAGYDGSDDAKTRVKLIQEAMIQFCERTGRCFAILDTPPGLAADEALNWRKWLGFDSSYAALYYPWVEVANMGSSAALKKLAPPSGLMAGVYNRTDFDRGVHKAPANEVLRGVIGVERQLTREEQDRLNPKGINCIRSFPTQGIRAWGARTLSSNGAWCYISVRRLFIYVASSLEEGLQWVVFEPNDSTLWGKVRRDVTAFLTLVWRSGALFGTTPDQAFYVKCDAELNTREVRDMGQLIIEIGLAPVKPAEFVIVRISQWAGADAEANG